MEMANVPHTIGSQFLLTLSDTNGLRDLISSSSELVDGRDNDGTVKQLNIRYLSLGMVVEDPENILSKLNRAYCDDEGRPYADIRIQRALVIHDPFEDPMGMEDLLRWRGITREGEDFGERDDDLNEGFPLAPQSPSYDRPLEEIVPTRIQADDTTLFATAGWDDKNESNEFEEDEEEEDDTARQKRLELQERQEEEWKKRQETSKAVLLEMLGDRPTADIQAPENVLFVCKLNPFTNDEDLELIFSRFDSRAKAEIIRDPDTGASLQYAFVEFSSNEACNEAYLKMNNALVDDRRIRVDFSQSVAKVWDRYHRQYRMGDRRGVDRGFVDGGRSNSGRGRRQESGTEHVGGRGRGSGRWNIPRSNINYHSRDPFECSANERQQQQQPPPPANYGGKRTDSKFDSFGRVIDTNEVHYSQKYEKHNDSGRKNHRSREECSRSRSPNRDLVEDASIRRSENVSRRRERKSRSRSRDSSVSSRRRKKHRKHRRRDRSRSHERERKKKKYHRRRHRVYSSSDDDERRGSKHHQSHRRERCGSR